MKKFAIACLAVICVLSCKKSNSPGSSSSTGAMSVSYTANGSNVTVNDVTIDTTSDDITGLPILEINGMQLLPGITDSVTFYMSLEANAKNGFSLTGKFTDTSLYADSPLVTINLSSAAAGFYFADHYASANPTYAYVTANNGHTMTGTFNGSAVYTTGSNLLAGGGDSVIVTNGKFSLSLP